MRIVFAASECVPFAKTGGLADVVGALPPEIAKSGHDVTVYLPFYSRIRAYLEKEGHNKLRYAVRSITIPFQYYNRFAGIVDGGKRNGVQYYFVDCPEFFAVDELYGTASGEYPNNWERFAFFSRAVLEATKILGVPQVFHVHDWQTALIPVYLRTTYLDDPLLRTCGSVLTIHNAGYQGRYSSVTTERLLFPWDIYTLDKVEQFDAFNFLKGGIVYADMLTTVSRKYAEEVQTTEFGEGLEGALKGRRTDLKGILNGVDYSKWDPATDKNLAAYYAPRALAGKRACRKDLLQTFGLADVDSSTPVLGIVSRFATQKGLDFIASIAGDLTDRDLVLVALGSGESQYENFFRDWAIQNPRQVAVEIGYNDSLAHKIEAGADMFLMPSRYEPCGLNQIYSLKYGTVPIVRATGGLDDTIEEWNSEMETGTGFKFTGYNSRELLSAIDRALAAFPDRLKWEKLMRNGMMQNYSWQHPMHEYCKIYEKVAHLHA